MQKLSLGFLFEPLFFAKKMARFYDTLEFLNYLVSIVYGMVKISQETLFDIELCLNNA